VSQDTSYGQEPFYYLLSFDSFEKSIVLLFQQMIQNNWNVPVDGFRAVRGESSPNLFFLAFNWTVSVGMTNILIGIIVSTTTEIHDYEAALAKGEEPPRLRFVNLLKNGLDELQAPSGSKFSRVWQVAETLHDEVGNDGFLNAVRQLLRCRVVAELQYDEELLQRLVEYRAQPMMSLGEAMTLVTSHPALLRSDAGVVLFTSPLFPQLAPNDLDGEYIGQPTAAIFSAEDEAILDIAAGVVNDGRSLESQEAILSIKGWALHCTEYPDREKQALLYWFTGPDVHIANMQTVPDVHVANMQTVGCM